MKGPIAGAVATTGANSSNAKTESTNAKNGAENVPVDLLANPIANVQSALEKRLRNLGKRMQKLQQIKLDLANGVKLTEEQRDAISKAGEVELQVEFIKDLQKLANQQVRQYQRAARQKEEAASKKTQQDQLNLVKAVLKFEEVLSVVVGGGMSDNLAEFLKLTSDETDATKKLYAEICNTKSGCDTFEEYQNQLDNFANKMKEIVVGSPKEVQANLSGVRLQTMFNQMFETPAFRAIKTKKSVGIWEASNRNTSEEGGESDESSLNDFHQHSVDSSGDCSKDQKVDNEKVVAEKPTQTITALSDTIPSEANAEDVNIDMPISSATPPIVNESATQQSKSTAEEESPAKVSILIENDVEVIETKTTIAAQPDTNQTNGKDEQKAFPKEVNGEQRHRRAGNKYHRFRRDQQKSGNPPPQQQVNESKCAGSTNNPNTPYYNRGPRPNNYKGRRNSVSNNKQEIRPDATGNPKLEVVKPPRRSEPQRPRFFRNGNHNGEGNGDANQNDRPYVPRTYQGGIGDQQQQQRNRGASNGGGYFGTRNYERVPREHQPYECGLRFARD